MEASTYTDKKYIAASRDWVNVVSHGETGHEVEAIVGGKKVTVCDRYWNIPCSVHADARKQVGDTYKGITGVPCTVFASPDTKEIDRKAGGMSASEVIKAQEKIYKDIPGEKISSVEYKGYQKLMADGDAAFEKAEWKKANEAYTKVSKMPKKVLKEKGTEALDKLEKKGAELVEEAKGKIESEKEEARKLLKKLAEDLKPLPCSKVAADLLKELK